MRSKYGHELDIQCPVRDELWPAEPMAPSSYLLCNWVVMRGEGQAENERGRPKHCYAAECEGLWAFV